MKLAFLCDHPELTAILAQWHHLEWQALFPDWTEEQCRAELDAHTGRDVLPTTVIALEEPGHDPHPSVDLEARLLGSASLLLDDLSELRPYSPWLASVFVRPDRRGRGIGRRLVGRIEAIAAGLNIPFLYLFTEDRQSFYLSLGWEVLEIRPYLDVDLCIMRKKLL